MPTMRLEGEIAATAAETAPVPEPTSRTESPLCTPANWTKGRASLRLHLPMNRSYASPAENMGDCTDHRVSSPRRSCSESIIHIGAPASRHALEYEIVGVARVREEHRSG